MLEKLEAFARMFLSEGTALLVTFILAGVRALEAGGGQLLVSAADAAVVAAESSKGSGTEKFDQAVEAVKGTLQSQGLAVLENAVRLGVEASVARLKAGKIQ